MTLSGLVRSGVTAGVIGSLAVVVAGAGIATAATGGSVVLGDKNFASSTTTVKDSSSTPLALSGPKSKPPLRVNSSKRVKHLNASLLDGKAAGKLGATGSGASDRFVNVLHVIRLDSTDEHAATLVARTGHLSHGTYYFVGNATADNSGGYTSCFLSPDADQNDAFALTTQSSSAAQSLSIVAVKKLKPRKIGMYCYGPSTQVILAGLIAIKMAHSTPGKLGQ